MTRAAAAASATPVALATKGTVRLARGLASKTYSTSWAKANCTLIRPRTPMASASKRVASRTCRISSRPRVMGGSTQAESPEWMPASSMCSMIPPRYRSRPSYRPSTSISTASSKNRSTNTGCSGAAWVARETYCSSEASSYTICMPRPPRTYEGRTSTG